jgi:hypothetical protein
LLPAGAVAGWDLHPLESAALSRRTPQADLNAVVTNLIFLAWRAAFVHLGLCQ